MIIKQQYSMDGLVFGEFDSSALSLDPKAWSNFNQLVTIIDDLLLATYSGNKITRFKDYLDKIEELKVKNVGFAGDNGPYIAVQNAAIACHDISGYHSMPCGCFVPDCSWLLSTGGSTAALPNDLRMALLTLVKGFSISLDKDGHDATGDDVVFKATVPGIPCVYTDDDNWIVPFCIRGTGGAPDRFAYFERAEGTTWQLSDATFSSTIVEHSLGGLDIIIEINTDSFVDIPAVAKNISDNVIALVSKKFVQR